jgi:hypothetical protein
MRCSGRIGRLTGGTYLEILELGPPFGLVLAEERDQHGLSHDPVAQDHVRVIICVLYFSRSPFSPSPLSVPPLSRSSLPLLPSSLFSYPPFLLPTILSSFPPTFPSPWLLTSLPHFHHLSSHRLPFFIALQVQPRLKAFTTSASLLSPPSPSGA